jgi:hypothetical protein
VPLVVGLGAAGEPGRDRVVVLAHANAGLVVDPARSQDASRIERLGGQGPQVGLLCREVVADGAGAMADPAGVIGGVGGLQLLVELTDGGDHGDGDQVPSAEAAALTLHPTLLVGAALAGQAEERVEAVVAAQRDEPLVLDAVAALQDPRHRRLEVVVAHPAGHATEVGEAQHVTFEECLLRLGREHLMERPARGAQPHGEQPQLGQRPLQPHPQLGEVDLGLLPRMVDLGNGHTRHAAAKLAAHPGDVLAHGRLAQLGAVLGHQPLPDPAAGVALLLRQRLIGGHPRPDQQLPGVQHRAGPLSLLPLGRHRAQQRLTDRAPVHVVLAGQGPDAHARQPAVAADTLEQLHPRSHPFSYVRWCQRPRSVGLGRSGWGHFWRAKRPQVGPNQAVIPTHP